jgi:hypothetical protein
MKWHAYNERTGGALCGRIIRWPAPDLVTEVTDFRNLLNWQRCERCEKVLEQGSRPISTEPAHLVTGTGFKSQY